MREPVCAAFQAVFGKRFVSRPRGGDCPLRALSRYHKACAPVHAPLERRLRNTPPRGMSAGRGFGAAATGKPFERGMRMAAKDGALCHA